MDKSNLINSIVGKLEGIGIYPTIGKETDIEILKEFLDAKYSTGEKKITYTGLALFDDSNKVLYYYEKTKEESKGFSFGSDSESSFQSGTTLYRKIKSVGYAPDGKAYEYEIDIGQITKIFKETAKESGWKFKTVINYKKAKYGAIAGIAGVAATNEKITTNVETNSEKVLSEVQEEKETKQENIEYYKEQMEKINSTKKSPTSRLIKDLGIIYLIAIIFSMFNLIVLNASILGWVITAIMFVILIKKQDIIKKKSLTGKIFIWILIFIIIFLVSAFTMPDDSSNSNQDNNKESNNNSNITNMNNVDEEKTPYYITGESYSVGNGYDYVPGSDNKQIKPYTSASILISINNSNVEQNNEIKSIVIKNAKVTNPPKMGTPEFYFYDIITQDSVNQTSQKHLFNNNSFEYSVEDFSKLQAVQFFYAVKDIKTQDVSNWSVIGTNNAITKSGVVSDDVRSSITFEIEITNTNNKKYSMTFSQEIFGGDFLNDEKSGNITRYYYNDDIKYFQEI